MHVDGIIANISQDTIDDVVYVELSKRAMPVVFFDRIIENPLFGSVTINDRKAACEIVSYAGYFGDADPRFGHIDPL